MLAIAGAAAVAVLVGMALIPCDDEGRGGTSASSGEPLPVADVSPCSTPPRLAATSASTASDGLTMTADVEPQCSSGDLLSISHFG